MLTLPTFPDMEYADVCQMANLAADAADFLFRMNVFLGGWLGGKEMR